MLKFKRQRTTLRQIFILALVVIILPIESQYLFWSGAGLVLLGQLIHFISAGHLTKNDTVVAAGPYRYVRNPFYVGNFLSDLGLCLAAHNPYVPLVYFPIFYLWVIPGRVKREEAFLREKFGASYETFYRKVPRFFPRCWPAKIDLSACGSPAQAGKNGEFTWSQIIKLREIWRVMRAGGLIILFYLRNQIVTIKDGAIPEFDFTQLVNNSLNLSLLIIFSVIIIVPPIIQFGIITPKSKPRLPAAGRDAHG